MSANTEIHMTMFLKMQRKDRVKTLRSQAQRLYSPLHKWYQKNDKAVIFLTAR